MGLLDFHSATGNIKRIFLGPGSTAAIGFIIGWILLVSLIDCKCVNNVSSKDIPWSGMWYGALIIMVVRWML
jgi:hypothetical protein